MHFLFYALLGREKLSIPRVGTFCYLSMDENEYFRPAAQQRLVNLNFPLSPHAEKSVYGIHVLGGMIFYNKCMPPLRHHQIQNHCCRRHQLATPLSDQSKGATACQMEILQSILDAAIASEDQEDPFQSLLLYPCEILHRL